MIDTNPYNSPNTPSGNADALTDFRSRAVAASEMVLRSLPGGLSPERGNTSCCLVRQPSLSRLRRPLKITAIVSAILGISGLATGGIIVHLQKAGKLGDDPNMLALAVCCSVGGILFMFLPTFVERWIVRKHLPQREEEYGAQIEGIHIAVEYAPTYGSLKILAEDVGLIYIHPASHYVKISGLSYDYVVHSKDVVGLSLHSKGKTVLLSYVVGDERLDLAILPRSLVAEFKRQTLGSSRSLFVKIQDALKV